MIKRLFDVILSIILIVGLSVILVLGFLISSIDTRSNGLFFQTRVGQYGKYFTIYKLKTISDTTGKISTIGKFLRKYKIDELPQLFNILKGDMSFVGPRPDLPGYYDTLTGEDALVLNLKPGLTSRASIKYSNEEELLAKQENPLWFNDHVIFPDKVKMNLKYFYTRSVTEDFLILIETFKNVFYTK